MKASAVARRVALAVLVVALALIAIVGAFPVGLLKPWIAKAVSDRLHAPVAIGSITREPFFSFSPTLVIHDLKVAQPAWAGRGDLLRANEVRVRLPILALFAGRGFRPDKIEAKGFTAALVRDASRRSNWGGQGGRGGRWALADLTLTDGRFTLRDMRRHLDISGTVEASAARGLKVAAHGRFHDAPVTLSLSGSAISNLAHDAPYPFRLAIASPLLDFRAQGQTVGALNLADMTLSVSVRAPSLKYLDNIIQAGLFGTQAIDLQASVRRQKHDWFLDRVAGRIGRSRLSGRATLLKRDGRSKLASTIAFDELDFDDLADDAGLAAQAAIEARIGDRVLPNTRINLSRVGRTDGQIRFSAQRLLFKRPSVFRSLRGVISLDGKVLKIDGMDAQLTNGRLTGRLLVDHRTGISPRLDVDLQFRDGSLGAMLGAPDRIDAPFGARIILSGRGDTIRDALAHADGKVGFVAGDGQVSRAAAAILAQDMGKAIGAALSSGNEMVALRCIAVGFQARGGLMTAAPFLIETEATRSRGEGTINLDNEQIALTVGGTARDPSLLPLVDPIRVGGTLAAPTVELSSLRGRNGGMLGALVKSIGSALGLTEKKGPQVTARGPIDCRAIAGSLLDAGTAGEKP